MSTNDLEKSITDSQSVADGDINKNVIEQPIVSLPFHINNRFVLYHFGQRCDQLESDISKLIGFPKSIRLITEINQFIDETGSQTIPKKHRNKYSMIYLAKDVGTTVLVDKGLFKDKLTISIARDNYIHEYQFIRKSKSVKKFSHNTYSYEGTIRELFDLETIPVLLNHESYVQQKYYS